MCNLLATGISLLLLASVVIDACVHRDYGYRGTVCVCNATYCDLPAQVPDIGHLQFITYTSSLNGSRLEMSSNFMTNGTFPNALKFVVDASTIFQKVVGFGGAFTDSAGINIASISLDAQQRLLEAYFSQQGIGYTLGRVPIAGSDFSTRPYTYAEGGDTELRDFQLTEEDHVYKIPYIKRALELNEDLRILAAAWTAPPWMKTNNDYVGVGSLKKENYQIWSDYHLKFLDAYSENDIQIWALSTGNEPLNGDVPLFPFNCMGWTPANQAVWITQHLGPALRQSSHNNTLLIAYDDQRFELPAWLKVEFADEAVSSFVSGIGIHWYWDNIAPLDFLNKAHDLLPDKFMMATEACFTEKKGEEHVVHLGSWDRGETYAESVIDDMTHWVAGWVDWNLALDTSGGPNWAGNVVDAAIIVNSTADEFYKQPMFYALGHFSKFIPVGSRRIQFTGGTETLKGIAFNTPKNQIVIVVLNKAEIEQAISIECDDGKINITVPPKSITTILSG